MERPCRSVLKFTETFSPLDQFLHPCPLPRTLRARARGCSEKNRTPAVGHMQTTAPQLHVQLYLYRGFDHPEKPSRRSSCIFQRRRYDRSAAQVIRLDLT